MRRSRPKQHKRKLRSGKTVVVNKGVRPRKKYLKKYNYRVDKDRLKKLYDAGELEGPGETAMGIMALGGVGPTIPADKGTRLIVKDGNIVGSARIVPSRSPVERRLGVYNLNNVFIRPSMRGKGLGSELVENAFKNEKMNYLVGIAEPTAEDFWRKQGGVFTDVKTDKGLELFYIPREGAAPIRFEKKVDLE